MSSNFTQTAAFIWSVADLLRGDFKQSQYGRIILPFTLLRRLECVLQANKSAVIAEAARIAPMKLPEDAQEKFLHRASGLTFSNISPMDLSRLGEKDIKDNLLNYVSCFSRDAREIFDYFNFSEFVGQLSDANLLYKVTRKFATTDLSPVAVSNHGMGLVFEELIRRFAESSNETAGEHFTPRDIVHLTTSLVFMEDDAALTRPGIIRTIYDPTAGTGGFLSSGMEYVHDLNKHATMGAFGQELNPESYAICKADMLIKGQDISRIKLGNTLSNDHLPNEKFDYMLSNPPFGVDWKKVESDITTEHMVKGHAGRFGPGLPRVSDGSLLFLMHLISKLPTEADRTGRIGIILNGSPLFTGSAGSGESEIRRYILETDLLETIVALPNDMFYNTGIATYVWILTNNKSAERKGKVQLINGVNLCEKMRKSLGSKRNVMSENDIAIITRSFANFEEISPTVLDKRSQVKSSRGRKSEKNSAPAHKTFASKIFPTHAFGYRRITVERALRTSAQLSNERLADLRFAPKPFNAPMRWVYEQFGAAWAEDDYGVFDADQALLIRAKVKADFSELKEAQIKDLTGSTMWRDQAHLLQKALLLQSALGSAQWDNYNLFDLACKNAQAAGDVKLDSKEKKQFEAAVTWTNPAADRVIAKNYRSATLADPLYGLFACDAAEVACNTPKTGKALLKLGDVVEFATDSALREHENVPLDPSCVVKKGIEAYFLREVAPHVPDAWIDDDKRDKKDGALGIVGYEINFNRYFYQYQAPRQLADIDADLQAVEAEIAALLSEVTT
ncbi:type I restriction-modification system subunit M [Janthinobacterium sp. RA13]|uniref:type I restriction-modification system subunit M n=1 Tax=Janthinobacterium sp. RA13 TaxID=1502762 RepID=UPI000562B32A|nr:class I SAM-dependent DNA methyltransferase [Janthinobacterium sp. RA13]